MRNTPVKRVFIIGIDGAGNGFKDTDTPNLDKIMKDGAYTNFAKTSIPTISGECWGSCLHGVGPEKHGLTNAVADTKQYPEDSPYPSFMKLIRKHFPDGKLAAYCNWSPIFRGIIENSVKCDTCSKRDAELTDEIVSYIKNNDVKAMFIQLDEVDGAGHAHGYWTEKYYEAIKRADGYIGQIYDAISAKGYLDESLIIICCDHGGGGYNPKSHGSAEDCDTTIFWGCSGSGVNKKVLENVNIKDTPLAVAYALGIDAPKEWDGKVPQYLFNF